MVPPAKKKPQAKPKRSTVAKKPPGASKAPSKPSANGSPVPSKAKPLPKASGKPTPKVASSKPTPAKAAARKPTKVATSKPTPPKAASPKTAPTKPLKPTKGTDKRTIDSQTVKSGKSAPIPNPSTKQAAARSTKLAPPAKPSQAKPEKAANRNAPEGKSAAPSKQSKPKPSPTRVAIHPPVAVQTTVPTKPIATKPTIASSTSKPIAARKPSEPLAPAKSDTNPDIVAKIRSAQAGKELRKDLAQTPPKKTLTPITKIPAVVKGQDRIILMVRDPYWLHAHWDITRQTVDRAKAALAEHWHAVKPILRLLKLEDNGTTESAETIYRDLEIHGGVRNWYIDVDQPPSRFQIVMGYMTASGRFYELVRSNTVSTPVPGGKEASDDHWADIAKDAERIYAMSGGYGDETQRGELSEVFEERLKRTMDIDVLTQFGSGAEGGLKRPRQFHFSVDAEIVVFGSTHPDAHVTIGTDPVKVRNDGSFSVRLPFPDRRQVLPATARSRDGVDEQTVVIAVERNTKVMEPLSMEGDEP